MGPLIPQISRVPEEGNPQFLRGPGPPSPLTAQLSDSPACINPPWQRQVQTWGHYSIGSDIHSLGRGECDEDKLLPLPSLQILQSTCTGSSMGYRARRRYCCKGSPLHTPSSEICCVHFIQRGKGPWQVSNSEMKMNIRL